MDYVSSVSELNYLSQIVIMLYEDPTKVSQFDDDVADVHVTTLDLFRR